MDRAASANLDLLRTIAVLLVLLNHLTRHYHYDHFDDVGTFGLLLFFVHTSLVLMYSMQRSHLTGAALVKNFYVRRFFRIYPLSVLAVIPNFLPGIVAFTLPEKRVIPSWLWPLFVLAIIVLVFFFPTRRVGAATCLLLGSASRTSRKSLSTADICCQPIATYSYGIYLGHAFFIWWALTEHDSWVLFWLLWLIVPAMLYHVFERPAIDVGKRLAESLWRPRRPILEAIEQNGAREPS